MKIKFLALLTLVLIAFPLPSRAQISGDSPIITPENITQIVPVERIGRGSISYLDWHPDGEILALGGGRGIWLLDEAFNEVAHFTNVPRLQDLVWRPDGRILATLHESELRLWRVSDDFSTLTLERAFPVSPTVRWQNSALDRCLGWSADGQVLAVGTVHDVERVAERELQPRPLIKLEFYDSANSELVEITNPQLEREIDARCHYGAVSPDGQLETYLRSGYLAGSYYVEVIIAPDRTAEPVKKFTTGMFQQFAMDWHPSGDYITLIHQFRLQNVSWPDLSESEYTTFFNPYISRLSWSPNGEMLLAFSDYVPTAYLWSPGLDSNLFDEIRVSWTGDSIPSGKLRWTSSGELLSCSARYTYSRCDVINTER